MTEHTSEDPFSAYGKSVHNEVEVDENEVFELELMMRLILDAAMRYVMPTTRRSIGCALAAPAGPITASASLSGRN